MATIDEVEESRTALGAALKAGLDTLDLNQTITFTKYVRTILPYDGWVFWVAKVPAETMDVMGAIHYLSQYSQKQESTGVTHRVVFSAENAVNDLNAIAPNEWWIAKFDGIQFAFSQRGMYFQQANLHHYLGDAVYSSMQPMVLDDPAQLDPDSAIVSNSLPIWLYLSGYAPPWHVDIPMPPIPLYPSFLSPANISTPYGVVHVEPDQTMPYASVPFLNSRSDHSQLYHDRVTVTLYNVKHRQAMDFLDATLQFSYDTDYMGIVGMPPAVRDDKEVQAELLTLAIKKRVVFEISYYQSVVRNLARQLILRAQMGLYVDTQHIADIPIIPTIP
jgi:hypothetical protein